jgi:superfamily II DNA or RNA helicase
MERTSIMPTLPQIKAQVAKFKQQPRPGQLTVFETIEDCTARLCVKLPTGYGKTYTAMGVYSILKDAGIVNRMLVIFPTDAQLQQFCNLIPGKLKDYAIDGPRQVADVRFFGAKSIEKHLTDKCQVFAITAQSLIASRGMDNIATMLQKGRWLVVVDEYHHYGADKQWGSAVNALSFEFLLCMSATPHRPGDDSAFGSPDVEVTYREAVGEEAVKELKGHAYHYKIDAIDENGEVISMTTEEIISKAGGDSPDKIERLTKTMRFSPKYISPLITNPIDRMLSQRLRTSKKLQAVVGCMSVSHAQLVCEQIRTTFPDLEVDWVGTGINGRQTAENASIIQKFAPSDGSEPSLDILVHVGMAGEGLDTVNVSEVIHLNAAGVNNGNNQENGRAARYLKGIMGHINFDGCSGYAKEGYTGHAIMDAMDCIPASAEEDEEKDIGEPIDDDWYELPDEPEIRIYALECVKIDSGDETVKMMIEAAIASDRVPFTEKDFEDPNGQAAQYMINLVSEMRKREAEALDEKSIILQWKNAVDQAVSVLSGNVIRMMTKKGMRIEKSMVGDIRRRINGMKKRQFGAVDNDIDTLKRHYDWLKSVEMQILKTGDFPSWLV